MAFSSQVEFWRSLAEQFSGDAPPDVLLDWISAESGGNRCNVTTSAGFPEVGLFQLDPGNAAQAGTDQATLLLNCDNGADNGTADDQLTAMSTGVDYVKALKTQTHQYLGAVGTDWDESTPDFWSLLRLQFSAGAGATQTWLNTAATSLGRGPTSWAEFTSAANNSSNHWVQVAAENGAWVAGWTPGVLGGGPLSTTEIALIAAASVAAVIGAMFFGRWLRVGRPV